MSLKIQIAYREKHSRSRNPRRMIGAKGRKPMSTERGGLRSPLVALAVNFHRLDAELSQPPGATVTSNGENN